MANGADPLTYKIEEIGAIATVESSGKYIILRKMMSLSESKMHDEKIMR